MEAAAPPKLRSVEEVIEKMGVRARALHLITGEAIDLLPGLPAHDELPSLKSTFLAGGALSTDSRAILARHEGLLEVVLGARPAVQVTLRLSDEELDDLDYVLHCFQHVQGASIRLLPIPGSDATYYAYDEDVLRSRSPAELTNFAITRRGLDFLILRDLAAERGVFHDLLEDRPSSGVTPAITVFRNPTQVPRKRTSTIPELYIPTRNRVAGLARALTALTANLTLFGHSDVHLVIIDNSDDPTLNDETYATIRGQGFRLTKIHNGHRAQDPATISEVMTAHYASGLEAGTLDPRISALVLANGAVDGAEVRDVVEAAFTARVPNIGGIRTYVAMLNQGRQMASMDDDAFPFTRTVTRAGRAKILSQRRAAEASATQKLYAGLTAIEDVDLIDSAQSFFAFLRAYTLEVGRWKPAQRREIEALLQEYHSYDPTGEGGHLPRAAGQLVTPEVEDRLRFIEMVKDGLPRALVAIEDTGTATNHELPDIDAVEYEVMPVDVLGVFSETLGTRVGDPEGGRLLDRDLRGIAGVPATAPLPSRPIVAVTGHFSGDRDLNALDLMQEALAKWHRDGVVDVHHLQQVVRKAIFVEIAGCVSTRIHNANQFCFNFTSVDNTFAFPTTGGWLRIEEPYQATLFKFLTDSYLAWARVVGGHERLPGSERPKVPRQGFWEQMALALYIDLEKVIEELMVGLEGESDPEVRIRALGQSYMDLYDEGRYQLSDRGRASLQGARARAADLATNIAQSAFEARNDEEREQLELIRDEIAEEFHLEIITVTNLVGGGHVVSTTRRPITKHEWNAGRLKEGFEPRHESTTVASHSQLAEALREAIPAERLSEPGAVFACALAPADLEEEFLERSRQILAMQLSIDGHQLLAWPDILAAGRVVVHESPDHPLTRADLSIEQQMAAALKHFEQYPHPLRPQSSIQPFEHSETERSARPGATPWSGADASSPTTVVIGSYDFEMHEVLEGLGDSLLGRAVAGRPLTAGMFSLDTVDLSSGTGLPEEDQQVHAVSDLDSFHVLVATAGTLRVRWNWTGGSKGSMELSEGQQAFIPAHLGGYLVDARSAGARLAKYFVPPAD